MTPMQIITAARDAGFDAGFEAHRAKVFIPNPHVDSHLYHHWADGYSLGVLEARRQEGTLPDNDNERRA